MTILTPEERVQKILGVQVTTICLLQAQLEEANSLLQEARNKITELEKLKDQSNGA